MINDHDPLDQKESIIEELKKYFSIKNKLVSDLPNNYFLSMNLKNDIELDSVDVYELVFYIEENFNVTIKDENIDVRTVDDVVKIVCELII